ncbi:prepilin-type N-terminal cleavage/methylation domain-containing protein [Thioflavicoccus mobilis 8321]|uniref:Prepilin-type N-terminal cleavage/methylation domain-containing protein n=1 Tax=Thioflavicoccus mobilis 8321 TaxID=765912 RepID=L0GUZ4_9GAMM|nr:prepilin-type N-terminal cleavage/methylation domain-containing protein [Thioflavicoccus mobilis]AGA89647.1 prepilin-type N-terminal cleavage/methylation domain-containing protein [Thioflavicoccus mobilis 8321]
MVNGQTGFSLIELMITLLILSITLLVGVPFTGRWVQSAQVQETRSLLLQGYGQAAALALRNPLGVTGSQAAASLKLVTDDEGDSTLLVCEGPSGDAECAIGGSRAHWQTELTRATGVAIRLNGAETGAASLDNTGLPITGTAFLVTKGEAKESGTLR